MAVIVKKGRVNDGNKIFKTGEVIPALSKEDEDRLIKSGACEALIVVIEVKEDVKPEGDPEGDKTVKGKKTDKSGGPDTGMPGTDS